MRVFDESPETSDVHQNLRDVNIIVLFGPTGSGKSTFANIASGDSMRIGRGLTSCTKKVEPTAMFTVDGKPVVVIDSPGFDDTYASDAEILKSVAGFLSVAYTEKYKITGLLFMHKITDTRVGGKALLHMRMFRQLCGLDALKNVVYVTNMWSEPPTETELLRESELCRSDEFFGTALTQGAQVARHYNTRESAHNIIRKVLPRPPGVTKLAKELVDESKSLDKTRAGAALGLGLEEEVRKLNEELRGLREDHAEAIRENNEIHRKAIHEMERKAQANRRQLEGDIAALKRGHKQQATEWNNRLRECSASVNTAVAKATSELTRKHQQEMRTARISEDRRREELTKAYNAALAQARNQRRGICVIA